MNKKIKTHVPASKIKGLIARYRSLAEFLDARYERSKKEPEQFENQRIYNMDYAHQARDYRNCADDLEMLLP